MIDEAAILIGRLPARPPYEPLIVTALRAYHRRRAPESLLHRLAGGRSHWRRLNEQWVIDGRLRAARAVQRPPAPDLDAPLHRLSPAERTILLTQLVREYLAAGAAVPLHRLRRALGLSANQLERELSHLRIEGEIPSPLPTVDVDAD